MKEFVKKYIDLHTRRILEISAYDRPTFSKHEANIFYLDIQTREEMLNDAKKNSSRYSDYIRDIPDRNPEHSVEIGIYYGMNYIGEENNLRSKINLERSINDYDNPHFGVHCHTFSGKTFLNKVMKPILLLDIFIEFIQGKNCFIIVFRNTPSHANLSFEEFVN
jgi:hypothetical protein